MKRIFASLMVLPLLATAAFGAVPKEQVAADAKWLLHVDITEFRSGKVGGYITREILDKKLAKPLADLKNQFKFEIDPNKILERISSVTIYGMDYHSPENNAVVLIRADADLEKALVGGLAGLSLAGSNSPVTVQMTQLGAVSLYSIKDSVFIAVLPGKVVAVGKTRAMTQKAAEVLAGKAPNLTTSKAFSGFADIRKSFFFLGIAEGFNADTFLPPQARVLQMADGGRIVLGENADQIFLNLALKGKTPEIVTQMQQVLQGLIALGSLGKPDDQDLARLIQSIKVSADDKVVSVSAEYPADKVIQKLDEQQNRELQHRNSHSSADNQSAEVKQKD